MSDDSQIERKEFLERLTSLTEGMDILTVARMASTGLGTVSRWRRGISSPHPIYAKHVLKVFEPLHIKLFLRKPMRKIIDCETEQPVEPQAAYVDGYTFGDRLLEGVMFKITLDAEGNPVCEGVEEGAKSYCAKFSKKQMQEWCSNAVEMTDSMTTLDGRRDLMFDDELEAGPPANEEAPRQIGMTSIDDILNR